MLQKTTIANVPTRPTPLSALTTIAAPSEDSSSGEDDTDSDSADVPDIFDLRLRRAEADADRAIRHHALLLLAQEATRRLDAMNTTGPPILSSYARNAGRRIVLTDTQLAVIESAVHRSFASASKQPLSNLPSIPVPSRAPESSTSTTAPLPQHTLASALQTTHQPHDNVTPTSTRITETHPRNLTSTDTTSMLCITPALPQLLQSSDTASLPTPSTPTVVTSRKNVRSDTSFPTSIVKIARGRYLSTFTDGIDNTSSSSSSSTLNRRYPERKKLRLKIGGGIPYPNMGHLEPYSSDE